MFLPAATPRDIGRLAPMDSKSIAKIQDEIRRLGPPDPDVESAWLKEVERRAGEIESGQVKCVPAEEVFRQLDVDSRVTAGQ